jgi:hypothetical protein
VDEATRHAIRESALRLLGLPEVERQDSTEPVSRSPDSIEVVATLLATRELDEAMQATVGRVLAERARQVMSEKAGGRNPTAVISAEVDSSDDAECPDLQGDVGNASVRGERCYRIVLEVAASSTNS